MLFEAWTISLEEEDLTPRSRQYGEQYALQPPSLKPGTHCSSPKCERQFWQRPPRHVLSFKFVIWATLVTVG
jgi:hypothetical protein